MLLVYPVIIEKNKFEKYYNVFIPDFNVNTEGESIADSIEMARDAIGLCALSSIEDFGKELPSASEINSIKTDENSFVTLVDVNYEEYKRKHDNRTVRRNVTLPAWLDQAAREAKINVSSVLKRALKSELNIE